jgi:ATP-dependent Clp protease ATP-binding subunit ClpB
VFHRLSREEIEKIVEIQLRSLAKVVADRGITLTWTPDVLRRVAARGYDPTFGARPLKRVIQKEIADALAEQILAGNLAAGDHAEIVLDEENEDFEIRKAA